MASSDINLADRPGSMLESHKGYDPRLIFFYFLLAGLLLTLVIALGYQQLTKTGDYKDAERQQNQRRIVVPGPRGNIYDRNHKLLVGNHPRFSVRLLLDTLRPEIRNEQLRIKKNYRALEETEVPNLPTYDQLVQIARVSVVQKYLDQVNAILGRFEKVDVPALQAHFRRELLLPYTLLDDLKPGEYAKLIERLPVNSPAQVYTTSTREYPFGSAASHTLGYIGINDDIEVEEDLPGDGLKTIPMKGTLGRDGIEKKFDAELQGENGVSIFRVDPSGNRINPPLKTLAPSQGHNLVLSLDIDLQQAAEKALRETEMAGAAAVMDVNTGEVLVLASMPDYNLRDFSPRMTQATYTAIEEKGGWLKRSIQGAYSPGSSFKILVTIAGLRSGALTPQSRVTCPGFLQVGNRKMLCHNGHVHGDIGLTTAIEKSCNVYYYKHGIEIGDRVIAAEARRFHLDRPTGIELPDETRRMIVPDRDWKRTNRPDEGPWTNGDTALTAIGQGYVDVTPLQMACFTASFARNEVWTQPTLLHHPDRPTQHTEPIGLTPEQRDVLLRGMEAVTTTGTGHLLQDGNPLPKLAGLRIGGKTGTAQRHSPKGTINFAWLIAFAPIDKPQIAMAIAIEGDTPGEETGGGRYAAPVAHAIFKTWLDRKNQPAAKPIRVRTE
ncbi:MAG TPA: penicillin-binding transpeptidase domain-containing protein [Opitutaceae bacterium]|nr:penicillin-binding transpeptidase domain-containing protein [Opitutaceae bacterium]